jgi:hypothetical protein
MKANSFIKHLFFSLLLGCFVLTNTSIAQDSELLHQDASSFVESNELIQFAELIQQSDKGDEDSSSTDENQDEADEKDKDDRFLGMEFLDYEATLKLLFRLVFNFGFVFILVRLIYYPSAKRKDFLFTYMLISLSIFLLCFMLENVKLDLAFALGLFAIFGIIRYRTDPIPIKEMTYLFIVIAISVMNALVNKKISYLELVVANLAIIGITYGLEKVWLLRHESFKIVLYENIELIKSGQREALEKDLEERTGIKINRVEIGRIDFLRDTALLRIYFYEDDQLSHYEESSGGGGD